MARIAAHITGLACLIAVLASVATASAAPTWLAPVDLSPAGESASGPAVGVDGLGNTVAVWKGTGANLTTIEAASRPGGGAWLAPVGLSAPGSSPDSEQVAVAPSGDAVAVWSHGNGSNTIAQASVRPAGGAWQPAVNLSAPGQDAGHAQVAIDSHGNAVAVWYRFNGTHDIVQSADRPAGGGWTAPVDLSGTGYSSGNPQVALDAHGDAFAVWYGNGKVEARVRPAGGAWQPSVDIAAGESGNDVHLGVDDSGDAVAVWQRWNGSHTLVASAIKPAGGAWRPPVDLSAADVDAFSPQLATNGQGDAAAVWYGPTSASTNTYSVRASVRLAGGSWSQGAVLSDTAADAAGAAVALDTHGNAIAVWYASNGTNDIIQAAVRPATGDWQPRLDLSAAGADADEPAVAFDQEGSAVAVWRRSSGSNFIAQAAAYDAAGPQLGTPSIPATGTAGTPLSFAVTPLDLWSPLGTTGWGFGDGGGASGTSVNHTYASAGNYPVTVTGIDAVGNTTTSTATVAIAPPPQHGLTLSGVRVTNKRFRVGRRSTATAAKRVPLGTSFRFTLSEVADVRITITRAAPGRRHGSRCVAPSAGLRAAHAARCTRTLLAGTLTRAHEHQGSDSVRFTGRIGRRALHPHRYTATLRASNADGRAKAVALGFTVVR